MFILEDSDINFLDRIGQSGDPMVESSSASSHGVVDFLGLMTMEGREMLSQELAILMCGRESKFYKSALAELIDKMTRGYRRFRAGETPRDGTPDSDDVIWGHTVISDPEALVHFIVCHYIERYVCRMLADGSIPLNGGQEELAQEIATGKDTVIHALSELLLLRKLYRGDRKPVSYAEIIDERIFRIWTTPKDKGGLGWISKEEENEFYRKVREVRSRML